MKAPRLLSRWMLTALLLPLPALAQDNRMTADALKPVQLRSIGPGLVTGRIADIAIDRRNPSTWYVATAFGGLWKTTNRGTSFTPIFDNGGAHNLCCVVIDNNNSDVLWLGTGENLNEHVVGEGWPAPDLRLDMLEEAIEVMRLLWKGDSETHRGCHFTVERARLYTLPPEPPLSYAFALERTSQVLLHNMTAFRRRAQSAYRAVLACKFAMTASIWLGLPMRLACASDSARRSVENDASAARLISALAALIASGLLAAISPAWDRAAARGSPARRVARPRASASSPPTTRPE